LKIIY